MPRQESIKLEVNVPARMRDGAILYADVYRPEGKGKFPAVLTRSPYSTPEKAFAAVGGYMNPRRIARAGYAVVVQDMRGTGVSEGEFYPYAAEVDDGYDTVEWLAAQPGCDGNVGMYGLSAGGVTQWAAAVAQPPHLKAICPGHCPGVPRRWPSLLRDNGVFRLRTLVEWYAGFCAGVLRRSRLPTRQKAALRERLFSVMDNVVEQCRFLPLKDAPVTEVGQALGVPPFFADWLTHVEDDAYWQQFWYGTPAKKVVIPALHICGWNDDAYSGGVLHNYLEMCQRGGSALARKNQKLLMGPWIHSTDALNIVGGMNFGIAAAGATLDVTAILIRWFDYWLKGSNNKVMDEPPVRIFVMGDNVWREEGEWPLDRTKYTKYYLHSGGQANSLSGNGMLSTGLPDEEPPDVFLYDPRHPAPTIERGILDQTPVEKRADVLVYTSAPLDTDVEVTGPIEIRLWAASSAVDTDFTGRLVDVWPDGKAYNMVEGIVRARYRESVSQPKLIVPGEIYEYAIDMVATSNVFKAGHRIRVDISSSNFPTWDRNLNTGHSSGESTEMKAALQTVHHQRQYPSHIVLPVIPR